MQTDCFLNKVMAGNYYFSPPPPLLLVGIIIISILRNPLPPPTSIKYLHRYQTKILNHVLCPMLQQCVACSWQTLDLSKRLRWLDL